MKVPDGFIPDENLENATEVLLNPPYIGLEDLVLKEEDGFPDFINYGDLPQEYYPELDESKIEKAIYSNYTNSVIDMIKFRDKEYLSKNLKNVKQLFDEYNIESANRYDLCFLRKDEYALIIYSKSKDHANYSSKSDANFKEKAVNIYMQRFGFEEVK